MRPRLELSEEAIVAQRGRIAELSAPATTPTRGSSVDDVPDLDFDSAVEVPVVIIEIGLLPVVDRLDSALEAQTGRRADIRF